MNQIGMLEEGLKKLDNDYYIERRIIAETDIRGHISPVASNHLKE